MKSVYRLKKSYQFNYVYRKGKTVGSELLVLHFAKNNNGRIKVGFCVSKHYGKAAQRNLVKRRLRFAFSQLLPFTDTGYNYIVSPRASASVAKYPELFIALKTILTKTARYNGE
ncbi:MAG: ribonuclease P protein component [Clostridia bacterium]